jgi:hypothetical protein
LAHAIVEKERRDQPIMVGAVCVHAECNLIFFVARCARRRSGDLFPAFQQSIAGRRTDGFADTKFKVNE